MTSRLEFNCKLAHLDEIKILSKFNSIRELYQRIGQHFSIPIDDILYCTLNTHNARDMDAILGNYLSSGDLIVVHLLGESRDLTLRKSQEYLGLTITDNGQGKAFVKKVRSEDQLVEQSIRPGDHIAAINSRPTAGMRHYEVAKAIREVPLDSNFTLSIIEPRGDAGDGPDGQMKQSVPTTAARLAASKQADVASLTLEATRAHCWPDAVGNPMMDQMLGDDLINSSLPIDKLLAKTTTTTQATAATTTGPTDQENLITNDHHDSYKQTIEKINSILESFLGINDNLLAIRIYRLARENRRSYEQFKVAIKVSELNVFNFDEDIEALLWNCSVVT